MTRRQKQLLDFIRESTVGEISPSFEEMQAALGLKSKSGVHRLITALEEQGRITRDRYRARRIYVVDASLAHIPTAALINDLARRGLTALPSSAFTPTNAVCTETESVR